MNRAFTSPYPMVRKSSVMDMNFPHDRLAAQSLHRRSSLPVNLDVLLAQLATQQMAARLGPARRGRGSAASPMQARMHYFAGPRMTRNDRPGRAGIASRTFIGGSFSPAEAEKIDAFDKPIRIAANLGENTINPNNSAIVKTGKLHPLLRTGTDAAAARRGQP